MTDGTRLRQLNQEGLSETRSQRTIFIQTVNKVFDFFVVLWELFTDIPTELQESRLQEFRFVLLSYRLCSGWSLHG